MKKKNYYVIGDRDNYCYGGAATLAWAKRLASKSAEYWEDWQSWHIPHIYQGWHIPKIYRAEDVRECENFYGATFCSMEGAEPVAVAYYNNNGRIIWESWGNAGK